MKATIFWWFLVLGSVSNSVTEARSFRKDVKILSCSSQRSSRTVMFLQNANFHHANNIAHVSKRHCSGPLLSTKTKRINVLLNKENKALKKMARKKSAEKSQELKQKQSKPINFQPRNEEQFEDLIKHYEKNNAPRRVAELWDEAKEKYLLTPALAARLIASLLKLQKSVPALRLASKRKEDLQQGERGYFPVIKAISMIKGFARSNETAMALELAEEVGVFEPERSFDSEEEKTRYKASKDDQAVRRGQILPTLALAVAKTGDTRKATQVIQTLRRRDVHVDQNILNTLLAQLGKAKALRNVFDVMDVFPARKLKPNDETFEFLANSAVRNVEFVTGAVSMETLPRQKLPEAAVIGRSNVGKSSLINMVCNRKSLAFTSKRPGKTQQFNYFLVNGGTKNKFHLVDVPGLGYAKVPKYQRQEWLDFLTEYIRGRNSLRVLFHLIDSRHGPVDTDLEIMELMKRLPDQVQYVIVLTKADKRDGKISKAVLEAVEETLQKAEASQTPVITTSSESRLGRDAMWRYLKLAALNEK